MGCGLGDVGLYVGVLLCCRHVDCVRHSVISYVPQAAGPANGGALDEDTARLVDAALHILHPHTPMEAENWSNPKDWNGKLENEPCPGCGILMYIIARKVK